MGKTILFVINSDSFFISHRLPIALAAKKEGYEVHVAAGSNRCFIELSELGLIVHKISLDRKSGGLISNLKTFIEISKLYLQIKPHIVHLVTIKPILLGGIAARLFNVPALVAAFSGLGTIYTDLGFKATIRRGIVGGLYRFALGHKTITVIFQNEDDLQIVSKLAKLKKKNIFLIKGSGVDLTKFRPKKNQDIRVPIILCPTRMLKNKGVNEFLEAAMILKKQTLNARFVLVGDVDLGNPETISENTIKSWDDEGIIEWWGFQKNMPEILNRSYVVVLPSYREGLPKVLIEAAATGTAVITTDVPGCRDSIIDSQTGILVEARNSVALARAIQFALDNPKLIKQMGLSGRSLAENCFDIRSVIKQHLSIYKKFEDNRLFS